MSYSVSDYGKMISDKWRMDAYYSAIRKSIKKNSVVIDLGAGTGIFSFLACKFGARRVYAIEPDNAINLGIKSAEKNGFSDKIHFINDYSTDVILSEKADLIIADVRGTLPLYGNNLEIIMDARKRFLKKTGVLIPGSDQIWCSIVQTPSMYNKITGVWAKNNYNLDLSDGKNLCLNNKYPFSDKRMKSLSEKKKWLEIDYYKVNKSNFKNKLILKTLETGTAHGILLWFNSDMCPGVKLLNSPGVEGAKVYGKAFLPFLEPVGIKAGGKIELVLSAVLDINNYIWSWKTRFFNKYGKSPVKEFTQSSFFNNIPSPENYLKKSPAYNTSLNNKGAIDCDVLNMFAKEYSVEKTANIILKKYPSKFRTTDESIRFVGIMSMKYSN